MFKGEGFAAGEGALAAGEELRKKMEGIKNEKENEELEALLEKKTGEFESFAEELEKDIVDIREALLESCPNEMAGLSE